MNQPSEKTIAVLDNIIIVSLFVLTAFSMFSISITQISGGVGGLAWLLRTHLTESWSEQRWPLGIPFGLYVLACLIAVADAYDVGYSYPALKKLFEILIFFWVINCVQRKRLRDSLIILLIISATVAGLYGFYQVWQNGDNPFVRVEGTMSTYMTFAGLLMIVGMLSLGRMIFRRPHEMWLWPSAAIISVCLLLTLTRQAWLGFMVGGTFLVYAKKWKLFLISIISIYVLAFVFKDSLRAKIMDIGLTAEVAFTRSLTHRIQSTLGGGVDTHQVSINGWKLFSDTFGDRVALWKVGWKIFKDHPLTGCGFSCVDLVHSQYPDPTGLIARLRGMHSNFIQLAVDTGILGLSAWMGIWFCFFSLLYKRVTALKGDSHERGVILGSMAAALAFLAGGFFESNFYDSEVAMVLYLVMALPFAGSANDKIEPVEKA